MKVLFVFNHKAPYKISLFNGLAQYIDLTVYFERDKAKDRNKNFYNENEYNFKSITLKNGYIGKENSFSFKLKNYIKNHYKEFDLIIMNGYSTFTEMIALNFMIKHNVPYSFYINGGIKKKGNIIKRLIKEKFIRYAQNYFSPGIAADPYLIDLGANKDKIFHYSYSTIYENEILKEPLSQKEKDELLKKYHLNIKGKTFVTSGQFIKRKNNMQLIKLFALRKENLVLIGDGKEKKKYLDYINKNKIFNVDIVPFLPKKELLQLISCFDYYITLSKEDIYGHTVNEAFSRGLPVICSNKVIAGQQLIKNGNNSFLVDIDNEDSITKALNNIESMKREEVIKTAMENTIEKSIKDHLNILKGLEK